VRVAAGGGVVTRMARSVGAVVTLALCFQGDRWGKSDNVVDDSSVDGGDVGDGVSYERGDIKRLESSLPSLSSSTSQRLFLVRLEGGDFGSGDSAVRWAGWALTVNRLLSVRRLWWW
jgi:hypothetical protein